MRLLLLLLATPLVACAPPAAAEAVCAEAALCTGESRQRCGGPSPHGDAWDGFTGAWGEAAGLEYGVGGWDRCYPGYWSAGVFVSTDAFPLGGYETVQARFDRSPDSARPCYLSAGAYGFATFYRVVACPEEKTLPLPLPAPAWGALLP